MAALDWSECSAVESVPGKVSGASVFKGTRTPVAVVFENLEDGMTIDEVLEQFPVTREQVKAVLEFAARSLDAPAGPALMRVLFDDGTPRGVAAALSEHAVEEARARGWDTLKNGELLDAAEAAGFDVFVTTDRNIRHQQNLTHRKIAVVVLGKTRWKPIKERLADVAAAVAAAPTRSCVRGRHP